MPLLLTSLRRIVWFYRYTIGELVDTLIDYCGTNNLDPKKAYIWICCLCINQHRVVQQSNVDFMAIFAGRVKQIGHTLAMMAPWKNPLYLERLWCVFELYTANKIGSKLDIIVPPKQRILQSTVGSTVLNNIVNELLCDWVQRVIADLVTNRENTGDLAYGSFCSKIGKIQKAHGELDSALELFRTSLAIFKLILKEDHSSNVHKDVSIHTAGSCGNIGNVLSKRGDYDGALVEYKKCLAIEEAVLGKGHPDTAATYDNIGLVLVTAATAITRTHTNNAKDHAKPKSRESRKFGASRKLRSAFHFLTATITIYIMPLTRSMKQQRATALLESAFEFVAEFLLPNDRANWSMTCQGTMHRCRELHPLIIRREECLHPKSDSKIWGAIMSAFHRCRNFASC